MGVDTDAATRRRYVPKMRPVPDGDTRKGTRNVGMVMPPLLNDVPHTYGGLR